MADEPFKKKDRIMIIGGSSLGTNLLKELPGTVLIESSPVRYKLLVEEFGDQKVIHGDGSDPRSLLKAGIKGAKAVVITTNKDRVNYKIAMAVLPFKVKKVLIRLSDESKFKMAREYGFEPFKTTAAMSAKLVERILNPASIHIHEFILPAKCRAIDMKVDELDLPEEVTLVSILRDDHLEVPEPRTILREGDVLTVIASEEEVLKLRKILGARLDLNPLQRIYVPYNGKRTIKYALREAFILAKYANAEVQLVYDNGNVEHKRSIEQLEQMFKLQKVAIEVHGMDMAAIEGMKRLHEELDEKYDPAIRRESVLFECVMLDPEASTFLERLSGNTPIGRIIQDIKYPMLIAGNMNPYKSILLLLDPSDHSDIQVSLAIDIAILFGSRVHLLVKMVEDVEAMTQIDRLVKYVTRAGHLYGLEITQQNIEGNPTLEFVENVKSDRYDLVVVNWNCRTIKKDIVRRTVEYGPRSVLIIP